MRKLSFVLLISLLSFCFAPLVWGQGKFALVIGNGDYIDITRLNNPVNDANDIALALEGLGFSVVMVLNGSLSQMEEAVLQLKEYLSTSADCYGFFFYSGHGVQSVGENYLLPVDAVIPNESYLRNRALSMQAILDALNTAGNRLNIVILDACRDNPFSWSRNINSGLSPVTQQNIEGVITEGNTDQSRSMGSGISGGVIRQPAGSIVMYSTSAGETASDGNGKNGLFTTHLLNNITIPGLEVNEVFRRTGADVSQASGGQQIPAIYNQFFGTAYFRPPEPDTTPRLRTLGAFFGSSFNAPWVVTTVRATFAPFNYSFLELGIDIGLVSGAADVGYYSLCPFIHYAFFLPFSSLSTNRKSSDRISASGWYIGAGGGYITANYAFPEGDVRRNGFVMDIITGFTLFNFLDISYTLRTNFSGVTNKFSLGYTYRWN